MRTGSPVFPFYLSIWPGEAPGWDAARSRLYQSLLSMYGDPHSALDYVLAPIRLAVNALELGERTLRAAAPGGVVDDARERVGGRLGIGERGDRSRPEAQRRGGAVHGEEVGEHGLVARGRGRLADGASHVVGACHEGRDEDGDERVDRGVGEHRAHRPAVVGGRG